jgi:hypothetical protein
VAKEYIIRVESARANTYGLGEVVSDRVAFFKDDGKSRHYGLTKEELDRAIKALPKETQ